MKVPTLILPYPPTVNTYWRSVLIRGQPRVLLSKRGRRFRLDVQEAVIRTFGIVKPTRARLWVAMTVCPPDRRVRDISNVIKATEDAITHAGLWVDDSQIDGLMVLRGPVVTDGRMEVRIARVSDEPAQQRLLDLAGAKAIEGF